MLIYKYELQVADMQSVMLPEAAQVLSVQEQAGKICLWAMVQPNAAPVARVVYLQTTGTEMLGMPADATFFGTVQMYEGRFVVHCFITS